MQADDDWPHRDLYCFGRAMTQKWRHPAGARSAPFVNLLLAGLRRQVLFTCIGRVCGFDGGPLDSVTVYHRCWKRALFCRTSKRLPNSTAARTYGRCWADRWLHRSRLGGCGTALCAVLEQTAHDCVIVVHLAYRHSNLCRSVSASSCKHGTAYVSDAIVMINRSANSKTRLVAFSDGMATLTGTSVDLPFGYRCSLGAPP